MSKKPKDTIAILGSGGGVANALLSIFQHAALDPCDPLHDRIKTSVLHLIDIKQQQKSDLAKRFPHLAAQFHLHQLNLRDINLFRRYLKKHRPALVIDVSWADTLDMLACCNELSVPYVNTALENTMIDDLEDEYEGFPLIERYRLFEQKKAAFQNTTAIVCSGMNPGVVNWMALEVIKQHPTEKPLGLYIVEEDTSFFADPSLASPDTLYTTWSPECFLDEAIHSYPMLVQGNTPLFLYNEVYELEFKVRLGSKQFFGRLMPHEESLSLADHCQLETGFLYKVNPHTTSLIKNNLHQTDILWEKELKVLDPTASKLSGADLVGVLLVYPDKERFMYHILDNQTAFAEYGVNATYLQVASGVYGAAASLLCDAIPRGIYYVEDLVTRTNSRYGEYVTYHLKTYVQGENPDTDGTLLNRMQKDA